MLKLYEGILKILDEKGPLPISSLCNEANNLFWETRNTINPMDVKSVITLKNELFMVNNEVISIHPDKQPVYLMAYSELAGKPSYQVRVDFKSGRFIFMEWRDRGMAKANFVPYPKKTGDFSVFKEKLYSMNIWDWEPNYLSGEGIVLDGTSWSIKLRTKTANYESSGVNKFPENWEAFCSALRELTGSPFR